MSRRIVLVALIASVATILSACGDEPPPRPQAESGVALRGDFSGSGPGTLLAANSLPTIDRRLAAFTSVAARIEYTSTSGITNTETRVSGTVFAPKGAAPEGGWPIIAFGHSTSGIEQDCAPSLSPSLLSLAPAVAQLVTSGYVVAISDYQGLDNGQSYHPYLEPTTEGYNLIDSVRAARKIVPKASDRWVATGLSQGGQAAWAANEQAAEYGKGLSLLGSVSVAPPLDLTFLADAAAAGTLTADQRSPYQAILASLKNEHSDFDLDDYRRGVVEQDWNMLLHCDAANADERAKAIDQISTGDLRPSSIAATDRLREYLRTMSLPQRPASAPMLTIFGGKDTYIPSESTDGALAAACGMGDVIQIQFQPDKGHADLDISATLPWIVNRFKGAPVTNDCAAPASPEAAPSPEAPAEGDGA